MGPRVENAVAGLPILSVRAEGVAALREGSLTCVTNVVLPTKF